jgi:hypothetical protein
MAAIAHMHGSSKAMIVASTAIIAAILSTAGAAQDVGMPEACAQGELQRCSLQVWSRDSFPHQGVTQSVTFANGLTLTCTSTGRDRPRNCSMSRGFEEDQNVEQCSHLKKELSDALQTQNDLSSSLHYEQANFDLALEKPYLIDTIMDGLRTDITAASYRPPNPSDARRMYLDKQELDFLTELKANELLGPEIGKTAAQMQERANRIIAAQRTSDNVEQQHYDDEIKRVQDLIAKAGCDNVPSYHQ